MSNTINIWGIVPAAGIGSRMGADLPKQYLKIAGKTILELSVERLLSYTEIRGIVVAVAEKDEIWPTLAISRNEKVLSTTGGAERWESVLNALNYLEGHANEGDWVMVHDAARPCVRPADIETLVKGSMDSEDGGLLALRVRDTMKRAESDNKVSETVDRANLWHALTPQLFPIETLVTAMQNSLENGVFITDESQSVEYIGLRPKLIPGHSDNIKITLPEDLKQAEFNLNQQEKEA